MSSLEILFVWIPAAQSPNPPAEIPAAVELWVVFTLAALGLHMLSELRKWKVVNVTTKLLASTGFVLAAISAGALEQGWSRWLFVGLVLSWFGDAFLLGRNKGTFLAGLVSFLLGHVGYCIAFVTHGVDVQVALTLVLPLALVGVFIDRWLGARIDEDMRLPVRAYIVVISIMLSLAFGAWRAGASHLLVVGAVSFYLSDLSVARDRFVEQGFMNRLWGLPAYYLGQLCLALSVLGLR